MRVFVYGVPSIVPGATDCFTGQIYLGKFHEVLSNPIFNVSPIPRAAPTPNSNSKSQLHKVTSHLTFFFLLFPTFSSDASRPLLKYLSCPPVCHLSLLLPLADIDLHSTTFVTDSTLLGSPIQSFAAANGLPYIFYQQKPSTTLYPRRSTSGLICQHESRRSSPHHS